MGTSGARGERFLEANGQRYTVLFTNRALAEAERALARPIIGLLTSAQGGDLSIGDVARLLQIGLECGRRDAQAPGPQLTLQDAWGIMDELGFSQVTQAVFGAVADVLSYRAAPVESESPPM
jgi:hypothetical protein